MAQKIRNNAKFPYDLLKGSGGMESGVNNWLKKSTLAEIHERDKGIYLFWGATVKCDNTCDCVITADDIMNGIFPEDRVAEAYYGLDAWGMKIPEEKKRCPLRPAKQGVRQISIPELQARLEARGLFECTKNRIKRK